MAIEIAPAVRLFIEGECPSQKNSKRIIYNRATRRTMIISSSATYKYVKNTDPIYSKLSPVFVKAIEHRELPLRIEFQLVRKSKARFDYLNILQVVCDQMQKHKWIPDDSMYFIIPVIVPYIINKENPGVYITVI